MKVYVVTETWVDRMEGTCYGVVGVYKSSDEAIAELNKEPINRDGHRYVSTQELK